MKTVTTKQTEFAKPLEVERQWFLIDGAGKSLGRVAAKAASIVRGKEKANFTPNQEMGDYVVIINAGKLQITGNKAEGKLYRHHTGYPGGLKTVNYNQLAAKHPTEPLAHAIRGMLPKGPLGRKLALNVKIYEGGEHPHAAQAPQAIDL
jgi:large subunit ribosomal protein L13